MKKTGLILVILLFFIGNSFCQSSLIYGLTGYYPFTNNAAESSGNGRDGIVYGAVLVGDRHGLEGGAYCFNGIDSYIEILPSSPFLISTYSFSCWVKFNSIPSGGQYKYILSLGSTTSDNSFSVNNNSYQGVVGGSYNMSTPISIINAGSQPNINTWYHFAITRNNSFFRLYSNGVLIDSTSTGSPSNYGGFPQRFIVGSRCSLGLSYFIDACIDEICIYNRVLSSKEVLSLFSSPPIITTNNSNSTNSSNLINIYPNPASSFIQIDFENYPLSKGNIIEVTNVLGQKVYSYTVNNKNIKILTDTWTAKGMYFVSIIDQKSNAIIELKKIIVL